MKKTILLTAITFLLLGFTSCNKEDGFVLISLSQEKDLGLQMKNEILSKPSEYPILNATSYPDAYTHLNRIKNAILNSGELNHKDDFEWEVYIIKDDEVVNAFATPGGYMYFYTGLIKTLDNEAQFAGVMAHEMAHADRRHSAKQLQITYGLSILSAIIFGTDTSRNVTNIVRDLALGLGTLKFSRDHEYEADEYAVRYLYKTDYNPPSLADFFEKLSSQSRTPEFLSTHPDPGNRVEEINKVWQDLGGKTGETFNDRYGQFKASLP